MAVENVPEVSSEVQTPRPPWSWGSLPAEAQPAPSPNGPVSDPAVVPPSVELAGQVAPPAPPLEATDESTPVSTGHAAPAGVPAAASPRDVISSALLLLVVAVLAVTLAVAGTSGSAAGAVVFGAVAAVVVVGAASRMTRG